MGYIEIPGLGFVYSVTGIEDPNVDRAVKRVEEKLVSSNVSEEERNRLRQQLMGLNKKKKTNTPRVNLQPVEEKGIDTSHSLSKNEQEMA